MHSHFIILNESKSPIAIVSSRLEVGDLKARIADAVGEELTQELDHNSVRIDAKLYAKINENTTGAMPFSVKDEDGFKMTFFLQPTWEY